jgi:hypothetical protein
MTTVHKVILTNVEALQAKYSITAAQVKKLVKPLISADKARGLTTRLVDLSDASALKSLGGKPVTNPANERQTKSAIDAAYRRLTPNYLVILGAPDVVCHQSLVNPTGDDDAGVPSDLPYACDRGHSRSISDFLAPTRVVGRLPDLLGTSDLTFLQELIKVAANYRSRPRGDYDAYLGISAKVWKPSSALSAKNIFGNSTSLRTSPASGPNWKDAEIARRSHFINCHGAAGDFQFYGEPNFPIAHLSSKVASRLRDGTVAAAECCYGAELFDPAIAGGQRGICCEYLRSGAYGFFGSTNIAYGPAVGNGAADIITQDFFRHVLSGASLGRAALQARQDYVLKHSVLDPVDLKTLAQFYLLGDPAVHPVVAPSSHAALPKSEAKSRLSKVVARNVERATRREALLKNGLAIGAASNYVRVAAKLAAKALTSVDKRLAAALGDVDEVIAFKTLEVVTASIAKLSMPKGQLPKLSGADRIHFALGRRRIKGTDAPQFVAATIRESHGLMGDVRTFFSH